MTIGDPPDLPWSDAVGYLMPRHLEGYVMAPTPENSSMRLQYRDGTFDDDGLFDLSEESQRAYVAGCLNCNPATPNDWPLDLIDKLRWIRRLEGHKSFYRELGQMLSP